MRGVIRRPALLLCAALAACAHAPPEAPAGSPAPPDPTAFFPLAVGNVWTYSTVAAPLPALPDVVRIAPLPPKTFTITVTAIEQKAGDTVISLEEKVTYDLTKDPKKPLMDNRIIKSTIVCNAKKFDISPDSFFFAGEPGGYVGLTFDKLEQRISEEAPAIRAATTTAERRCPRAR